MRERFRTGKNRKMAIGATIGFAVFLWVAFATASLMLANLIMFVIWLIFTFIVGGALFARIW